MKRLGMIAGFCAGGFLIFMIGVGVGAYPTEAPARGTVQVVQGNSPTLIGEVIIPFPSEDSFDADYHDGALHIRGITP